MRGVRRAPHLVPNPRPRTPRFVVPRSPAALGLFPVHVGLAGLVLGLIAPAYALVAAGVCALGGVACFGRTPFRYEVPRLEGVVRAEVMSGRVVLALVLAALGAAGGGAFARERIAVLDHSALRPGPSVRVVGFVLAPPQTRFGRTSVPVRFRGERVLVRSRAPLRVRVGDELAARGELRRLTPREAYERRRGTHAVLEADEARATGRTRRSPVDAVRRRAEDALGIGLAPEQSALARGMVLGQDEALPDDLREAFRASGLSHLLAASGQNVMLLAALVLAIATALGLGLRVRLALALAAILFYVPLAGAGPSIRRAGVMGAAGLVAALAGKPASRWYAVLLAASVTLVLDPRTDEDVGWQLSFAAVLAILALHQRLRGLFLGPDHRDPAVALGKLESPLTARLHDALAARDRTTYDDAAVSVNGIPFQINGPVEEGVARRALARADAPAVRRVRLAAREAVADAAALTIAATLGTAPLICLHFGTFSLVSLPANLLAAPAVAPVMWLGTLSGVLGADAAPVLNALAAFPLAYLAWLARAAAGIPHATVPLGMSLGAVLLVYAGLIAAVLVRPSARVRRWLVAAGVARTAPWTLEDRAAGAPASLRPRWATLAPVGVLVAATALLLAPGPPAPPDGPTLTMLDIGQGDAILLQDGERAALFDTGKPGAPLVSELRRAGVRRLDLLVLTHSSSDHEGGLADLLAALPVAMVLDGRGPGREHGGEGGSGRFEGLPATMPRDVTARGQRFALGRIAVEILWPPPGEERRGDPNLTATVAVARTRTTSALLTADAESEVTLPLDPPDVDVLKVAHHGSADPGLPELLARTTPRVALIPVGENTYGHPAPTTLDALKVVPDVRRADAGTTRVPLGP